MLVKKSNKEVLIANDRIIKLRSSFITTLKKKASQNSRKRVRLNIHKNTNDVVHEMFIVHTKDTYVRPHKHLKKAESIFIVEGRADIFLFDEKGRITEIISMGDYKSSLCFYYKIDRPIYHTMTIKSDYLVFHEVTSGPFNRTETIFAPWSSKEQDVQSVKKYSYELV